MRSYMYYHEIMETEILPQYLSLKVGAYVRGREEADGVMNRYLAKSDRKPIPGLRASNRKGTALPSGSPQSGNYKFRLRGRAETAAALDLRGGATELTQVCRGWALNAAPNQGRDPISNAMRVRVPMQFILYIVCDLAKLVNAA